MDRHFTATGYVVIDNSILLHFHPKVKMWLPPGGHIELNEDPNPVSYTHLRAHET